MSKKITPKLSQNINTHAYGKVKAVSFGSVHENWKSSGPNLAPYPGSSGMQTGGKKTYKSSVKRQLAKKQGFAVKQTKKVCKKSK